MALPHDQHITEAEYLALEHASETRHEYIDGEVYAMSGASERHIDISGNIFAFFHPRMRKQSCNIYNVDMRVKVVATGNYFYPDMSAVCGDPHFQTDEGAATLLNPTLIIEVLSPSTELYDRTTKFRQYQQIESLREVVFVAQDRPHIDVYSRGDNDTWILRQAAGLDSEIPLPALDLTLPLATAYEQVDFPAE